MKKFLLSGTLISVFVLYTFFQRSSSTIASNPVIPSSPSLTPDPNSNQHYKDGNYTGDVADAFYGNVQVKAVIRNGLIADVQFLQYPNDRRNSIEINSQATPLLSQEAIQTQTANVDIVSGATATSQAFIQSLQSALNQAKWAI